MEYDKEGGMHWWEKEPLRIVEIATPFDLDREIFSLQDEVEAVKKLDANAQHFHCMQHKGGMDDTGFLFETRVSKVKNRDILKEYLPLAHKAGIRVIVYFNVHWYTKKFGKEHPDWLQIKEDGKPIDDVYTTGTSFCINSSYRKWVFQVLRDLCKYEIDGIFYDGPIFFANTCYCETCKRLFRERTGEDLPPKFERNHPAWKKMIDFQADSIAKFLSDSSSIIKQINPEVLFYMNGNSNWPYWPTGRDNHRIIQHTDILGAEGGFISGDLNQNPVYKPGITAKLLSSQANKKPTIVFDCAGHKPWSWYLLPEPEINLLLSETLAGGANWWVAIFPDDIFQPQTGIIREYNQFIRENPEPFFNTKPLANAALVWPASSVEFYSGSSVSLTDFTREIKAKGVGDITQEFSGFYEGLVRTQVPIDVIDEKNFEELSRYELLVLPNAACLSMAAVGYIKDFVKNGGNLVASFESSLYSDESGERKSDFQLGELFGVRVAGEIFGPMEWDYIISKPKVKSSLLEGITSRYIPATTYGIKVEPTTGSVLLYFCEKLKGCYDHTPEISSNPFLVMNQFGKGKIIYIAGTFGMNMGKFRFPEYLKLMKNLVNQMSSSLLGIESNPSVEVNLRKKGDKIFLHLINQTSGLKRPLTYLYPLTDIKINLFGIKVNRANALRSGVELPLEKKREKTSLVLPSLKDYEVIELEGSVK